MKRKLACILCTVCLLLSLLPINAFASDSFIPSPQTAYAKTFVELCDGQQWFVDEVERILNTRQKSINTIDCTADLDAVISIGVAGRGISGTIPPAVGELHKLRYLYLSGNALTGAIPDALFTLSALERIDLADNQYAGTIPTGFGTMPALRQLDLSGNAFTGTIPGDILSNAGFTFLDVASNQLSGPLPAGLTQMTGLVYLNISENKWDGAIPDFSALTELKSLSAWGCGLTGELPAGLYGLTHLQVLDLADNQFTGPISEDVTGLTALQLLALGGNRLTGEMPAGLGALVKLERLDLGSNRLEGALPDCFGTLTALKEIHLENNRLRGYLPQSLSDAATGGVMAYAQNNCLTGPELKVLAGYEKNFCDGAGNEQYQLTSVKDTVQINMDADVDLYPLLRNKSLTTLDTNGKPLLPAPVYTAAVVGDGADKVTLTVTQDGILIRAKEEIKKADTITIEISIMDNDGSAYSKVRLTVTTDAVVTPSTGGGSNPSTPSSNDNKTVYHSPYVDGYPDGQFGPTDSVTREQIAKMVLGAMEVKAPEQGGGSSYHDVQADRWSAPAIEKATELGYLQGYPGQNFGPADPMTRAQLAACLVRIAESSGRVPDEAQIKEFIDVDPAAWYADYVARAAVLGLVTGYGDGAFRPDAPIQRAEAVTMINRMVGRDPETAASLQTIACPFSDVQKSDWAYLQIMEAAVSHEHS